MEAETNQQKKNLKSNGTGRAIMRKVILVFLIVSMLGMICTGFSEADNIEDLLLSDKWVDILTYTTNNIVFSNGTISGSFENLSPTSMDGYSHSFFHDKPYTIDGDKLTVTSTNTFTGKESVFFTAIIQQKEGYTILYSDIDSNDTGRELLFCKASEYKKVKEFYEVPSIEQSVILITTDGEEIKTCGREIIQNCMDNPLRFENTYKNAKVTIVSKIAEISGPVIYNGHDMKGYVKLEGGWIIDVSNSINQVMDMSKGDLVIVTGYIWNVPSSGFYWNSNEIQVYIVNGHTTTIELFTE